MKLNLSKVRPRNSTDDVLLTGIVIDAKSRNEEYFLFDKAVACSVGAFFSSPNSELARRGLRRAISPELRKKYVAVVLASGTPSDLTTLVKEKQFSDADPCPSISSETQLGIASRLRSLSVFPTNLSKIPDPYLRSFVPVFLGTSALRYLTDIYNWILESAPDPHYPALQTALSIAYYGITAFSKSFQRVVSDSSTLLISCAIWALYTVSKSLSIVKSSKNAAASLSLDSQFVDVEIKKILEKITD
ncbi:hypothetical protein HY990_05175 [Candidatus Micrarchaeota archaeon]|nr:hypothetical protein [Candidatus Micrarchaeota archaeon]